MCDFTRNFPIIEGKRFFTDMEVMEWLESEEETEDNDPLSDILREEKN